MNKEFVELYGKATLYCSKSEKCISEVNQYLLKFCQNSELIKGVIGLLVEERYIDEQRYTNAFVNDRFKFSGWGKIKIAYMLKQKNIHPEIIHNSLDFIEEEKYIEFLKDLLRKKVKLIKHKDSEQIQLALIRFAMSRGFEYDIVFKTIKTIKI